jgi:nicotinate-nucleotide pyrophosphorylase (carboxylating)
VKTEIEVTTIAQLEEAIDAGADIVMLDNMTDEQILDSVKVASGRCELEVSGGITLERLPRLAKLGVDYVSMGALTHSARAMDLSLEILTVKEARLSRRGATAR